MKKLTKIVETHNWSEEDELIAFYCQKFGTEGLLVKDETELAESVIGTSKASLVMKRANFKHLMISKGFEHYSTNQVKVINEHSTTSRDNLKDIVNKIIDKRDLSKNKKEYTKKVKDKKNEQERRNILIKMGYNPDKLRKVS
jgi:hypothetical protein